MNSLHPVSLLKRMVPLDQWHRHKRAVSVGDQFAQQDSAESVWVVERISEVQMSSIPLVSLARVGHPDITKTVSLSALDDDSEYRIAV